MKYEWFGMQRKKGLWYMDVMSIAQENFVGWKVIRSLKLFKNLIFGGKNMLTMAPSKHFKPLKNIVIISQTKIKNITACTFKQHLKENI